MNGTVMDDEVRWRAFLARDVRFDGQFFAAVRTTGVFCRPVCPGRPTRENIVFFLSREASIAAGFRACKRRKPLISVQFGRDMQHVLAQSTGQPSLS